MCSLESSPGWCPGNAPRELRTHFRTLYDILAIIQYHVHLVATHCTHLFEVRTQDVDRGRGQDRNMFGWDHDIPARWSVLWVTKVLRRVTYAL